VPQIIPVMLRVHVAFTIDEWNRRWASARTGALIQRSGIPLSARLRPRLLISAPRALFVLPELLWPQNYDKFRESSGKVDGIL
jgi:hypothetical protein